MYIIDHAVDERIRAPAIDTPPPAHADAGPRRMRGVG
jgi:hypothetical protein